MRLRGRCGLEAKREGQVRRARRAKGECGCARAGESGRERVIFEYGAKLLSFNQSLNIGSIVLPTDLNFS